MRTLGILGGMGTLAGVDIVNLLVREAAERGVEGDSDYPEFIYYNLPTKALDCHGVSDDDMLLVELQHGLNTLKEDGANLFIVACNSAHRHIEAMQKLTGQRVVSLIEAACMAVRESPVGVLQSESCRLDGLYRRALDERGFQTLEVEGGTQRYVDKAILRALQGRRDNPAAFWVKDAIHELRDAGAKSIILACTEIPLLVRSLEMSIRLIDPGYEAVKQALNIMHNG